MLSPRHGRTRAGCSTPPAAPHLPTRLALHPPALAVQANGAALGAATSRQLPGGANITLHRSTAATATTCADMDRVVITTPHMSVVLLSLPDRLDVLLLDVSRYLCDMHGVLGQTYQGVHSTTTQAPFAGGCAPLALALALALSCPPALGARTACVGGMRDAMALFTTPFQAGLWLYLWLQGQPSFLPPAPTPTAAELPCSCPHACCCAAGVLQWRAHPGTTKSTTCWTINSRSTASAAARGAGTTTARPAAPRPPCSGSSNSSLSRSHSRPAARQAALLVA